MRSRKYYYRVITVAFNSSEEALRFLDLVTRKIKTFQLYARTRAGRVVELTLVGDPAEIAVALSEIKKIAKTIKEMYRKERGLATYDVRIILDYAKIEAAIPLDVAFKVLELLGHKVELLRGGKIRTDAELSEILEVIEQVSRIYREMMDMDITPQAKRIIAMWCTVFDENPDEAVIELETLGILRRYVTEDRNLVVLARSYDEAYREVKELVRKIRDNPEILESLRRQAEQQKHEERSEESVNELRETLIGSGVVVVRRSENNATENGD